MKHDNYRINHAPTPTRTSVPTNDDLVAALIFVAFVAFIIFL